MPDKQRWERDVSFRLKYSLLKYVTLAASLLMTGARKVMHAWSPVEWSQCQMPTPRYAAYYLVSYYRYGLQTVNVAIDC